MMNQKNNSPLRLVFHIGLGKTGTSSIQHVLKTHQNELKRQGFWYLGLMLEHAETIFYPWQKNGAGEAFLALDNDTAQNQLTSVFLSVIDYARNHDLHTLIWSNESFWMRPEKVIPVLKLLNIDISILAYIRRHDAWAKSAYVQWGIKHKTASGPVMVFEKWIEKNRKLLSFSEVLNVWIKEFDSSVTVRNFDAAGNSVVDFLNYVELNPDDFLIEKKNISPSAEELLLRAIFNNKFSQPVLGVKFNQIFLGKANWRNITANEFMASLMPTQEQINELSHALKEDRATLDEILAKNGQDAIDTSVIVSEPPKVDSEKLLLNLSHVVVDQALKIQALQNEMSKLNELKLLETVQRPNHSLNVEQQESIQNDQPVFVISTGRSGSTLVQRILNCHQDLVVWGEHYGFLNGIANAYLHMSSPTANLYPKIPSENKGPNILLPTFKNPAASIEWANPWSLEEFSVQLKNFIHEYFGSKLSAGQRWGFKEILYNNMATLRMLREIYPAGKFVFIKRDIIDVVHSKILSFIKINNWEKFSEIEKIKNIKSLLDDVKIHYSLYDEFMSQYSKSGIIINYKDIIKNPESFIKKIVFYLELDPDKFNWNLSGEVIRTIVSKNKINEDLLDLIHRVNGPKGNFSDV